MIRISLGLALLFSLVFPAHAGGLADTAGQRCLFQTASSSGVQVQLKANDRRSGIVSRTRTSVTFQRGYRLNVERRGGIARIRISTSDPQAASGYLVCSCSANGKCQPKLSSGGGTTKATCVPLGECSGACAAILTAPPPPAPDP